MSEGTRSPSQVIQSDNRPQKPLLWVGPVNRQPSSGRGGCGNGWEGLLVPSSNTTRSNVLEQPSAKPVADDCDARPGDSGLLDSRPVTHPVQPPARSGAGGPVRNSEAGRGEPETLESVLAAVGGAQ